MVKHVNWSGVFPAVTTQFREDFSLDIEATQRVVEGCCATGSRALSSVALWERTAPSTRSEKVAVMAAAKEVVRGRVPILAGIAEFTTAFAIETVREAERVGMDGIMVMPALVYSSKPHETIAHYEGVARACGLPIMVYNNPPIYRTDVTPEILTALAGCETIVAFKDFLRRYPPLHRCAQPRGRPLRALRRARRCGDGKRHGGGSRLGSPASPTPSRARARPCSAWRGRAAIARPCRSMNGSCLCCISMPGQISCNASSSARRSWAAAARSPARRAWPWRRRSGPRSRC